VTERSYPVPDIDRSYVCILTSHVGVSTAMGQFPYKEACQMSKRFTVSKLILNYKRPDSLIHNSRGKIFLSKKNK
jgi:hypothetical protein